MPTASFRTIARVRKTHGLEGEISVDTLTRSVGDLPLGVELWFVPPPLHGRRGLLERVRQGPKGELLTISGIEDVDAARGLVGSDVLVEETDLPADWPEAPPDPLGLVVVDELRGELGVVVEEIHTGANDVWVVHDQDRTEVLLPVIDDVVHSIDWDERIARVTLLPGLVEDD